MAVESASVLSAALLLCLCSVVASETNITAVLGTNVPLACQSHSNTNVQVIEWIKQGLKQYVFLYRNNQVDPENQYESYKNRVELKDKDLKDGDVSVILKNVNITDTGTYECRVEVKETQRLKRSFLNTDPISIIHLTVTISGGGGDKDGGDKVGGDKDGGDKVGGDRNGHVGLTFGVAVPGLLLLLFLVL